MDFFDHRGLVNYTPELERIEGLPRFQHTDPLVQEITEHLKTPNGTMTLRPLQALALEQLYNHRGLLGALPVGTGKTLITFVAATLLGCTNALLLIPAHLRGKTQRDFDGLADHWQVEAPEVRTYTWLSRAGQAEFLEEFAPDMIIADEAHHLKNPGSACTRRVFRYLRDRLDIPFCALTGTLFGRSLMDMHKLMALTLGPQGMPLPQTEKEAKLWASALDEKVSIRARPGALGTFLNPGEEASLSNLRKGVGRRIFQTPGIVASEDVDVSASITINMLEWPMPGGVEDMVDRLLDEDYAPNGDECTPADVYRHLRSLAAGFYYEWDPTPPWDWIDARRHWKRYVRDVLTREDARFDTELQVWNACQAEYEMYTGSDMFPPAKALTWCKWRNIKDTYKGNSVPRWISDETIYRLIAHVQNTPTLVWVEQVAVGEHLSATTGWPYYHNKGFDADGRFIEDHPRDGGPAIASIASNSEGMNLQYVWSKALVVTPPANGKAWEQILGRHHRPGQEADEVFVDVLIQHPRIRAQFRQAVRDARMFSDVAAQPRKLLIADYTKEV